MFLNNPISALGNRSIHSRSERSSTSFLIAALTWVGGAFSKCFLGRNLESEEEVLPGLTMFWNISSEVLVCSVVEVSEKNVWALKFKSGDIYYYRPTRRYPCCTPHDLIQHNNDTKLDIASIVCKLIFYINSFILHFFPCTRLDKLNSYLQVLLLCCLKNVAGVCCCSKTYSYLLFLTREDAFNVETIYRLIVVIWGKNSAGWSVNNFHENFGNSAEQCRPVKSQQCL